jgi:2-pyrone-4,6-dicarboxylate lactonase
VQDEAPEFTAPPLACDSHFHVFGPAERYRYAADLRYQPPHAPLADYLAFARRLGIERYVLVQPSAYGRDNTCLLDAMRDLGEKCRGIVDIDEDAPDAELERLNAVGVRGVRVNVNPIKPPEPGYAATMLARVRRLDARCAELGWMLDFLTPGWLTRELLPTLTKLASRFTVAHMGCSRRRGVTRSLASGSSSASCERVAVGRSCPGSIDSRSHRAMSTPRRSRAR